MLLTLIDRNPLNPDRRLIPGGERDFIPWGVWLRDLCYCCCCWHVCWPALQRCWRTWQEEGVREELAARRHDMAERDARGSWLNEMSRRYGGGGGGYAGGGYPGAPPGSPRFVEPHEPEDYGPGYEYVSGLGGPSPYRPGGSRGTNGSERVALPRLGYAQTPLPYARSCGSTPQPASANPSSRRGPAYFPTGGGGEVNPRYNERARDMGYPTLSPRATVRCGSAYDGLGTRGLDTRGMPTAGGPGGYAGCGATPSGYAALASVRTRQRGLLRVHIKSAANLMVGDLNGKSDPYVVVRCPAKEGAGGGEEKQTRVVKKTLDPVWNETLEFGSCSLDELLRHGISLTVMDKDWITKDDALGAVTVHLDALRVQNYHDYSELLPTRGSLMFSVQWEPSMETAPPLPYGGGYAVAPDGGPLASGGAGYAADSGRGGYGSSLDDSLRGGDSSLRPSSVGTLHVYLDRATGLRSMDSNGLSDPYVKLTVNGVTIKSKTIKKTLDPRWREDFKWSGTFAQLSSEPLLLHVWDYDAFSRDDHLGQATLDLHRLRPEETREFPVDLSLQGTVYLIVKWSADGTGSAPISRDLDDQGNLPASTRADDLTLPIAQRNSTSPVRGSTLRDPTVPPKASSLRGAAWQPPAGSYGSVLPPVARPREPPSSGRPTGVPGSARRWPPTPACSDML